MHHGPLSLFPAAMVMTSIMAAASTMPWLPSSSTSNNANLGASAWAFFSLRWDSAQDARERRKRKRERRSRRPGRIGRPLVEDWSPPRTRGGVCVQAGRRPAGVGGGTSLLCAARGLCKGVVMSPARSPTTKPKKIQQCHWPRAPFTSYFFSFGFITAQRSLPKVYKNTATDMGEGIIVYERTSHSST